MQIAKQDLLLSSGLLVGMWFQFRSRQLLHLVVLRQAGRAAGGALDDAGE